MTEINSQIIAGAAVVQDAEKSEINIEELYDRYADSLFRYAAALTGSADDAEDAVQEVFIRIAHNLKHIGKVKNVKSYLYSATRNAAYSQFRSKKHRQDIHQAMCLDFKIKTDFETDKKLSESAAICEAFAKLPIDQREVILLKVFDEMTFKEISETTGISMNTVASRYRYAIEKLKLALEVNENE